MAKLSISGLEELVGLKVDSTKPIPMFYKQKKVGEAVADITKPDNITLTFSENLPFPNDGTIKGEVKFDADNNMFIELGVENDVLRKPKEITFLDNGNTFVADENGDQIEELQKSWYKLYLEFLKEKGIKPEGINFIMP